MFKEILGEAFPVIEKFAPVVATALGGPIAGNVISLIETVFDGSIKNPTDLINKIMNDPEQIHKLNKCNSLINYANGSIVTLWESLGKPTALNITWNSNNVT